MKKYFTRIPLLIFLLPFVWISVFAFTSDQAGKVLDHFKTLEKQMIFESDTLLLEEEDKNILSTYKRVGVFDAIWDKVQAKREYLQKQNEKIISRWASLEKSIASLDKDIDALTQEVNTINGRVIAVKEKVSSNSKAITLLKEKISKNTEVLLEYMVYLYKKGEFIKFDGDVDNLKAILLSGENIDELISDLYFKWVIELSGQKLIKTHRSLISELYKKQIELKQDESTLKALRKQVVIEKGILNDKKAQKQRLLTATKGQEKLYKKYIAEKLEVERDIKIKELRERIKLNNTKKKLLETYDCEFIDLWKEKDLVPDISEQCLGINKIIYAEARLSGIGLGNNPLDWPLIPYLWVSAFYRDEQYAKEFDTDHDAIDIVAPQGSDIKAPMDGYVVFIQDPVNAGYAYVALKHSDGLVTLYGHVSEVMVEKYDFVKKGEVFAKTGGEYGTKGAWLLTTGPHLHFVVYENEEYADPLEYLNISYLNFRNVPEKYTYKYYSDFRARKWYEFSNTETAKKGVFRIEGETELERQKFLLNTYATPVFRDWNVWVEESVSEGIDPSFLMCLWLAETSLGRHLKTPYNVGNVWNTDSWSTYQFRSAREWIHWIAKTFNNKYLSQYFEIQDLSRYGNKDESKPIYASSELNWHSNITKCMSHVKWYYIPDNYSFRVNINK